MRGPVRSSRRSPSTKLARLRDAIDALPEKYRTVITLYHLQGKQYEEIAKVLDLPMGTVKTHLFRAKEQLRRLLGGAEVTRIMMYDRRRRAGPSTLRAPVGGAAGRICVLRSWPSTAYRPAPPFSAWEAAGLGADRGASPLWLVDPHRYGRRRALPADAGRDRPRRSRATLSNVTVLAWLATGAMRPRSGSHFHRIANAWCPASQRFERRDGR